MEGVARVGRGLGGVVLRSAPPPGAECQEQAGPGDDAEPAASKAILRPELGLLLFFNE